MSACLALLMKDLRSELRAKETLALQLILSLLLSAMVSFGLQGAFLNPREVGSVAPVMLWLIFFFSATLSLSRSFEYELKLGALNSVFLTGVSPSSIYVAKLLSNCLITILGQALTILCLGALLNLQIVPLLFPLLLISLAVVLGYSALSTLLALLAMRSKLRGMLLPIILFPLLFPLLFAALELTHELFLNASIDLSSPWVSLLAALDLIYVVLGLNLFGHLFQE